MTQQALARTWPWGLRKAGMMWAPIMASSWLQYGSCMARLMSHGQAQPHDQA